MLIRREQLDAFADDALPRLIADLCAHLREHHAEAVGDLGDDELRRRVRVSLARARTYGLSSCASLGAFVATAFEVAPNFDEQPNINAALLDTRVSADSRMLDLVHRTTEADWEQAERASDARAWSED